MTVHLLTNETGELNGLIRIMFDGSIHVESKTGRVLMLFFGTNSLSKMIVDVENDNIMGLDTIKPELWIEYVESITKLNILPDKTDFVAEFITCLEKLKKEYYKNNPK